MIDGLRRRISGGELDQSSAYELRTSQLLERQARDHGFHFLDLAKYFADDFEANQQKFKSRLEYHKLVDVVLRVFHWIDSMSVDHRRRWP